MWILLNTINQNLCEMWKCDKTLIFLERFYQFMWMRLWFFIHPTICIFTFADQKPFLVLFSDLYFNGSVLLIEIAWMTIKWKINDSHCTHGQSWKKNIQKTNWSFVKSTKMHNGNKRESECELRVCGCFLNDCSDWGYWNEDREWKKKNCFSNFI